MKKRLFIAATILLCLRGWGQDNSLQRGFVHPPDSVKPGCYYYWINDNVSAEGVKKDIRAMARVGIGRAYIGNVGFDGSPAYGKSKLFSGPWWEATLAAISEGAKDKVDIGIFNSPGWSQSGGPWIKHGDAMRYLSSREIKVEGPRAVSERIAVDSLWQDVAVIAYRQPRFEEDELNKHGASIITDVAGLDMAKAIDGDLQSEVLLPEGMDDKTAVGIEIGVGEAMSARSLVLYPGREGMQADMELLSMDAGDWHPVRKFHYDRSNGALNVGFIPDAPVAISFPEIRSKRFRLVLTHIRGRGSLAEIRLTAAAVTERYMEKQLAKMFQTPLPLWNEYQWPQQAVIGDSAAVVDVSGVINLSDRLDANGVLHWEVPAGKWIIARYGMEPTGVTNSPATPEGRGYDVDKLNKRALQNHYANFIGKIWERVPVADRKSFKFMVADSYETGSQNWTDDLTVSFRRQYGYDPLPWLPALTGRVVGSPDQTDRWLWDLRRLVADKVAYDYVGGLRALAGRYGIRLWLENYGHWGYPSEFLKYGGQSDEVAGEFWAEGDLGSIECRDASSAAHIYGKRMVSAESFTSAGNTYGRYPGLLKRRGDWSFTEGINNTIFHVYIHQPSEIRPGINQWFGTEFNRHNTWFEQGKAFVDYIRRCNYMLRQGLPVDDVAYFIGEDAPKMTGVRDPALPRGFQFDYINAEVIETSLQVKDGRLVLPDGMSYRMLVLPGLETMRPELLERIEALVKEGAVVMGAPPSGSPSLQGYPGADRRVQAAAGRLWAGVNGKGYARYGKGMIIYGMSMEAALRFIALKRDFVANTADSVLYTHRSTAGEEIYFVSNQENRKIRFVPSFRDGKGQPAFWDPVTGETRLLPAFAAGDAGLQAPLELDAGQSCFVVFNKKAAVASGKGENFPEPEDLLRIAGPWRISFDSAMRGPVLPVATDSLFDWSRSADAGIRDYSGAAVYRTSFTIGAVPRGKTVYIDLGKVDVMARVKLNGQDAGTVWTAPYRVRVNAALRAGKNSLEIEVVNTWVNRLIGDSRLPVGERKTWSNVNPYKPDSQYESSGLQGPVRIRLVAQAAVRAQAARAAGVNPRESSRAD